jgi:hypothetical protein
MNIKIDNVAVPVSVYEAVRLHHASVTEMAQRMVQTIARDKDRLMLELIDLPDDDAIAQYFSMSGDVMIKAIVSLDFNGTDLRVELYVCSIERSASFQL